MTDKKIKLVFLGPGLVSTHTNEKSELYGQLWTDAVSALSSATRLVKRKWKMKHKSKEKFIELRWFVN